MTFLKKYMRHKQAGACVSKASLWIKRLIVQEHNSRANMLDVTAHMLLLLQQAQIKDERPSDDSFLPLSLSLACLLRQLPPGLAPPSGVLSFHQLDRLPEHILEQKLDRILSSDGDSVKAFNFVYSIVRYVKIARALLGVCHEHLVSKRSSLEAAQSVISIVVEALGVEQEQDDELDVFHEPLPIISQNQNSKGTNSDAATPSTAAATPPTRAVNASEVMKRAVSRDVGNGSAVLEIMRKYPSDEQIQSRGVRALKAVVRRFASESEPKFKRDGISLSATRKLSQRRKNSHTSVANQQKLDELDDDSDQSSGSSDESSDSESERVDPEEQEESETMKSLRAAIELVIDNMKKHTENLPLQRDGLLCLSEYVSKDARHVAVITSSGGIASIMDAMACLPDDQEANVGGLSVLAHPQIAGERLNLYLSTRSDFVLTL